ncbi:hypothetical protein HK102_009272 [Quaeritorhiza haematococci]|nr:hypothetical protein HK102_009272 [Quaeritorhiza haematococci]
MAEEHHGLFQFVDDSLFESEEKRVRHHVDKTYQCRLARFGWFEEQSKDVFKSFATKKLGPNEVLSTIEWSYLCGNYKKTLLLCRDFIVANNRPRKKRLAIHEVVEIAARCAVRLGQFELALQLYESHEMKKEPGYVLLRGKLLRKAGKHKGAPASFESLQEYIKWRSNDYVGWKEIAYLFDDLIRAHHDLTDANKQCCLLWANRAMAHALALLKRSTSAAIKTEFSTLHEQTEVAAMQTFLERKESPVHEAQPQISNQELIAALKGVIGLGEDQIEWIVESLKSPDDEDQDQEKYSAMQL